ncbi:MAG: clan AA aspartic protease [Candidatus Bathyarchaeia archaeon]
MFAVGYVRVRGTVANPSERGLKVELEFIVDTGAIYTVIPKSIADKLRLEETGRRRFKMADGNVVEYPISEAYITIEGEGVTSLVAIADEKTPVLLGVTTLELLGLKVDPVTGKLTPLELMILQNFI